MAEGHDPMADPNVLQALKERRAQEVSLIRCRRCADYSYYNDGSHFSCPWCHWSISGDELDDLIDAGEMISLEDYLEIQGDGPTVP